MLVRSFILLVFYMLRLHNISVCYYFGLVLYVCISLSQYEYINGSSRMGNNRKKLIIKICTLKQSGIEQKETKRNKHIHARCFNRLCIFEWLLHETCTVHHVYISRAHTTHTHTAWFHSISIPTMLNFESVLFSSRWNFTPMPALCVFEFCFHVTIFVPDT